MTSDSVFQYNQLEIVISIERMGLIFTFVDLFTHTIKVCVVVSDYFFKIQALYFIKTFIGFINLVKS